ncbi:MAG TPA: GNAT family N-acetyltransferase [Candidatus Limnocylindria bacterium]|nr:GNAT family N-acetyltransferase [Candidatus Limnocylindria bacterium]
MNDQGGDITLLDADGLAAAVPELATILADAVASGASVGFVTPFTAEDAALWWRSLTSDVAAGRTLLLLLRERGRAVGTAQLRLAPLPNARHRAEVAKVLVLREARHRGHATALMRRIEDLARTHGRTLLVLDTITGSEAARLYDELGWTRSGDIPRYAAMPDGRLEPTTVFFKELAP